MKRKVQSDIPAMIPNPAYLESDYFKQDIENFKDVLATSGECVEDFFPGDYDKALPPEGAWIMLITSVNVGKALPAPPKITSKPFHSDELEPVETCIPIRVPHLSIWYALPTVSNFSRKVGPVTMPLHKAVIQTPQGEVHVWPHEYVVVKDLAAYLQFTEEDGFNIHFLNPDAEGFPQDKLFYIRSRGIPLAEARRMVLPELKSPHFCYFTLHEEYAKYFPEYTDSPYGMRGRVRNIVSK